MIDDRCIRREEVLARVGLSYTTIWRMEKAGKFPKHVQLGPKAVGWMLSDVQKWLDARRKAAGVMKGAA